ncbi:MAG: hypothetical protein COA38_21575 [Fluviicola sp.]|nr:MAG: hypothetical protein COA38_21575 [Fluviicola sp.]
MAKVKLKLDQRKNCERPDGTFPLILSLAHNSKTRTISLKYYFKREEWDQPNLTPINVDYHKAIGVRVRAKLSKAESLIEQLRIELPRVSISDLKAKIEAEVLSNDSTTDVQKTKFIINRTNKASLTAYSQKKIERMRFSSKHGSADAIETAMRSIERFTNTPDVSFSEVDLTFLKDFCASCYSRGNKPNTVGAYLRQVKALYNEAIEEGIIGEEVYPFRKFKIPRSPKTKNRALRMSDIDKIRGLALKPKSAIWNARNYFLFMFNNMGLNFIDLVQLKKSQLIQSEYNSKGILLSGRIRYNRSKTQKSFSIKMTEESISILNSYDLASKGNDDFLFPVGYENTEQGRKRYKQQRKRVNRKMREMGKLATIDEELTTYFARHSWATIAKRKMIPVSLISEGLGHSNLKTTQIYLDSFDDDAMDDANASIVE